MKITTRQAIWGIELKNDAVTEEIGNSNQIELKETMINFLEATKDMANLLGYEEFKEEIIEKIDSVLNRLEDI